MAITPLSTQPNSVTRPTTFDTDSDTFHAELPTLVSEINATALAMTATAAGGAVSLQYVFSTTTTDADPGAGTLRLDAATQNTATTIRADLTGSDGSDLTGVLALLDDSTSTNKGYITIRHATNAAKWLTFAVASVAAPSGYRNVTVTCVASSAASPFANGDALLFDFTPTGDAGVAGPTGPSGALTVVDVTGTTQAMTAGNHYMLTNVAATTATLPASPSSGDTVAVTVANALTTNIIARNAQTIMGVAEDMTVDTVCTITLRFLNSSWRIV